MRGAAAYTRLLLAAGVALYLGLFAWFGHQTRILQPYSDLFDLVDWHFRYLASGDLAAYLLEPHGYFHRIVWLRMLVAADVGLFGGAGLPFVVAAALGLGAVAVLLARETWSAAPEAVRLPAVALTVMLLLTTANAADVSVPASTSYTQTLFFAVLALLLAEPRSSISPRLFGGRALAALACACGACFGNAVGLVIWPALALMAWRGGRPQRAWLAMVIVTGTAFIAAYAYGLSDPGTGALISAASLAKSADYFFAYLGLPWVRASGVLGRAIGVALFALALAAILRKGGPGAPRAERIALGLILFSLGTAALAALGRRDITAAVDVPVRYAILLAPLHIGLLLTALPWLGRQWRRRPRLADAAIVAGLAFLLLQQVLIGHVAARAGAHTRETIARFERGERTPEMTAIIHPDLARAEAVSAEMRRRGLYGLGEP